MADQVAGLVIQFFFEASTDPHPDPHLLLEYTSENLRTRFSLRAILPVWGTMPLADRLTLII
jgi:hypothetical protein